MWINLCSPLMLTFNVPKSSQPPPPPPPGIVWGQNPTPYPCQASLALAFLTQVLAMQHKLCVLKLAVLLLPWPVCRNYKCHNQPLQGSLALCISTVQWMLVLCSGPTECHFRWMAIIWSSCSKNFTHRIHLVTEAVCIEHRHPQL